ncbi:hypothetical protein HanXRQr2_Chr16g0754931 [Helianthus annuus]|uniref:Uncharacterized protein n=1 Tax=Helianthus annuus TaxID=4232 RepID=A0A9K3DRW3_HELAN|nr:hypothetical protein HanXRQr2_Chr16g0754931 [Helianthus annuus]KAJ0821726.1 hypothetical protein HanPSC8_Chr16g0723621 [Helianthus annuus]
MEGDERGPFSKAKRMSLKFASHERKNETAPMKWTEVRERGRERKKMITGRNVRSLGTPFGTILPIKKQ